MVHEVFTRKEREAAAKKATRLLHKYDTMSMKAKKKRAELDDLVEEINAIDMAITVLVKGYGLEYRAQEELGRTYVTTEVAAELDRIEEEKEPKW